MPAQDLIAKLKDANLTGRGGAGFPTGKKWEAVKNAPGEKKYIIANGSEGEPVVFKDGWLLENRPEEVINGLKLALETVGACEGILYLRHDYYEKFQPRLEPLLNHSTINHSTIRIISKQDGYIGGEETALIATLEGKRTQPSLRPPYPTTCGLYGCPTLVNNVETLYAVSLIAQDNYQGTRLYSIGGDAPKVGVFELPQTLTLKEVLEQTQNWPAFPFFLQAGGGGSGVVLNPKQLDQPLSGIGGIIIYREDKANLPKLLSGWIDFFATESCGQCTPCREGTYRLQEVFSTEKLDWGKVDDLLFTLEQTSFCALGNAVPVPILSFFKNVTQVSNKLTQNSNVKTQN